MDSVFVPEGTIAEAVIFFPMLILIICASWFIQILIHEAGHLFFGLLSGYKFGAFRILSFMWVKDRGTIRFCRHSLTGVLGQCIMEPPDLINGRIPFLLSLMGGSLMNILSAFAFWALHFTFERESFAAIATFYLAIMGLMSAIENAMPVRTSAMCNDGYNALSLIRNPDAVCAYWKEMKIGQQIAMGFELNAMPDEWFDLPDDDAMKNPRIAAIGLWRCSRLIETGRYEEADALMAHLLEIDSDMVDRYRRMMVCDRMCIEMIYANRPEIVEAMLTREQQRFMKSMKRDLTVLRTQYIYALLHDRNEQHAAALRAQFEKTAQSHPYPVELKPERELMDIAYQKATKAA